MLSPTSLGTALVRYAGAALGISEMYRQVKMATDQAAILVNAVSEVSMPLKYVPVFDHDMHCTRVHAFCCARTVRMRYSASCASSLPSATKVAKGHPQNRLKFSKYVTGTVL